MDTSSSASPSSRSDGEQDREEEEDSEDYGSCDDSDDADPWRRVLQQYQRGRSSGDQLKLKSLMSRLSEENDPSLQLTGLMELCEVLSFCTEDSLSGVMADVLSRVLVKLAKDESNGDIMLLAIRVITCVMLTLVIQEMSKKFPSLMDTLVHEPDQILDGSFLGSIVSSVRRTG